MAHLAITDQDALYYEYDPPGDRGQTFVFVNALTGNTGMWQAEIGPALRAAGYGTLAYNYRGQADSPFAPGTVLDQSLIVGDLARLMLEVAPPRPVVVGLSIGGLYAAWARLGGTAMDGLVLINTLRTPGTRLEWINTAMARAAALGGTRLVMDMFMPLLVNQARSTEIRAGFLTDEAYEGLAPDHGHAVLLANAGSADWSPPWEEVKVRTLVVTGLEDRVFLDHGDVRRLTNRLPCARSVQMLDAGHLIPVERPTDLVAALRDFAMGL